MKRHYRIAGIDEVGRGCIAGPVMAAVVILESRKPITGIMDSKQLAPKQREKLAALIRERALIWAIGRAEVSEIDRLNIFQAALLAMQRAYSSLRIQADWVQVDGNRYPAIPAPGEALIKGDRWVPQISAASILAKVARDSEMKTLDALYPGYGFSVHKGYPTKMHKARLLELGVTEVHRKTFAPVKNCLKLS